MADSDHRYKVSRVAAERGLADVGDELEARWTRETDPASLRDLATYFNQQVLRAAATDAGMDPLDGEVENMYHLLTGDDVSSGVRTETRRKLERNGVDVDDLESDFVTYQAVRTYLKDGRGVERDRDRDTNRVDAVADTVTRLRNRTTTVTAEKLARLERTDHLDLGEFQVLLDLRVFCEDCGTQYDVGDLLDRGGCQCGSSRDDGQDE